MSMCPWARHLTSSCLSIVWIICVLLCGYAWMDGWKTCNTEQPRQMDSAEEGHSSLRQTVTRHHPGAAIQHR
ncbi:hypothetical protein AMECASPLE_034256, partial [Ameca splendens]